MAEVARPVAGPQLVANQPVACVPVGNPQQGFRQAHEDHPFLARQTVFVEKGIETARFARPHRLDQPSRRGSDAPLGVAIEPGFGGQRLDGGGFVSRGGAA